MNIQAVITKDEVNFRPARRVNQALTASVEKRALQWMAYRARTGSAPTNSLCSA
jgi:hypothetical protein